MPGVKGMNKGNKNHYKGGRLNPNLSLSGEAKEFFRQQAKLAIDREPTDDEIKVKCREITYALWNDLIKSKEAG